MPRRFFKRFAFKRHELAERWFMAPFRHMLHDHRLWGIRRKTVVPAFSLGLAIAFMPFPGHALAAALFALLLRINIPVAALATLASNPLTIGPMFLAAYLFGTWLLGIDPDPIDFEISWQWVNEVFVEIWLPLMLGCILLGAAAALIGYIALDALWRYSLHDYKSQKRKKRSQ
ncbi:MAG: DUF2062 domain-containing protein [Woeseiaceae bacterium]|nr:DUF2062 domain-containing protein [Woeseiaceae bacterium]